MHEHQVNAYPSHCAMCPMAGADYARGRPSANPTHRQAGDVGFTRHEEIYCDE